MIFYDISPKITSNLATWPGEPAVSRKMLADFDSGSPVAVSSLHTTVHIGAHADAPSHYIKGGKSIDEVELSNYLGLVQLISVNVKANSSILPENIQTEIQADRVLFKTVSSNDPTVFNKDFAALSIQVIEFLMAKRKIKLIGIDTPSVDLFDSKSLLCHKKLFENEIAILEGLVLSHVPDGLYELIALPLPLVGFDASPVRAILIKKMEILNEY